MKLSYILMGLLTVLGVILHYIFWERFPDKATGWASLIQWVVIGALHGVIYAIHSRAEGSLAKAVVLPALLRLIVFPIILFGLIGGLDPDVKTLIVLFVAGVLLFMAVELGLVLRNLRAR